jgi:hypothetical protein
MARQRQRCAECGAAVHAYARHCYRRYAARANHDLCNRHWRAAVNRAQGASYMAGEEHTPDYFVCTVLIEHPGSGGCA